MHMDGEESMPPASTSALKSSPFFHTPPKTQDGALAILHLKKDNLVPISLSTESDGSYVEGPVANTRFGSFPHSTLIGLEWGSQVRASKVDTGAKGRKAKQTNQSLLETGKSDEQNLKKRKSIDAQLGDSEKLSKKLKQSLPDATEAAQGSKKRKSIDAELDDLKKSFKKLKQDVNGSDETEPASTASKAVPEAGSGFVHIIPPTPEAWTLSLSHRTQVVYTPDYSYILQRLRVRPGSALIEAGAGSGSFTHAAARAVFSGYPSGDAAARQKMGRVYSYEYHLPRVDTLQHELQSHGLHGIVKVTHRDVCTDGFALDSADARPSANAIFLDLPAPWQAIKHLTRSDSGSPLDVHSPVHICTFSPCIEQVMATVSMLRKSGWTELDMVEINNKRIDVRREQVGLKYEGLRGVNATAANVEEAVGRLREVENKLTDFHATKANEGGGKRIESKAERLGKVKREAESRKLYKEGQLVHRSEPEVKTHTSYLVFAILPRACSEEDERRCMEQWPVETS